MGNATIVNFASGETSPKSRGRFDIASYNSSCRKLENFIAEVSGAARFRPGFKHLAPTRSRANARLVPFQFNDEQAYMLEFSEGYDFSYTLGVVVSTTVVGKMRVFKDGARLMKPAMDILHIGYNATGGLQLQVDGDVTATLAAGDTVVISGAGGAVDLNGRDWYVAVMVGYSAITDRTSFDLASPHTGVQFPYAASFETTGATVSAIYEVDTPYLADELDYLQFTQTPDTMYLTHYAYAPRKLTVDSSETWTLATYSRTNDPFVAGSALTITGISLGAGYVIVSFALPATILGGQSYTFASIVGTTELNGNVYKMAPDPSAPFGTLRAYLLDPDTGAQIDGSAMTAYTSGGTATPTADNPIGVTFYESRLHFVGTSRRPRTCFASRSPVPTTGAARLDDFTGGTDADHACFFTLAPVAGSVDYITWGGGTSKYLLVGTFGGPFRVSGGGLDEPITPSSINVRQLDAYGCSAAMPALTGPLAYYIQRGGKTLRGVKYAADVDDFASFDMCLNADQIGDSELKRVVFQANRPDALWVVRDDGQLAGCTVQGTERIAGWHRHTIGGTAAKVLDVAVLPRPGMNAQLYVVTERTIDGATYRAVEAMADDVVFPDIEDYFTGEDNAATDAATYRAAALAILKTSAHLDAYEVYNSTPATSITGLHHLEGETVTAVADGVEVTDLTVEDGAITLPTAASIVVVGLPYTGLLQTQNLEVGGRSGPAQAKPRNINALNIRFLNSKGGKYGTDLYHLYDIDTEDPDALELADGSAAPVFNGIRALQHSDVWSTENDRNEKTVFIQQTKPFPCVVQFIDIEYETGDE